MIGYATLGTNDLAKASAFYDALLGEIGAKRMMADDHITIWTDGKGAGMLSVIVPNDGKAATVGNGAMIALAVDNLATIEKLHAKALELGATDEGAPGARGETMNFGYIRDLEGHKIAFFCLQ
jgi:catechol 2,3-dioxygenase-like lactoylglutathione lyase family enzyme